MAYRDDEVLELKPRGKRSQCKRIVIELEACTPSSATSADFLIAASRPSAHARLSSPPSATSRGMLCSHDLLVLGLGWTICKAAKQASLWANAFIER